MKKLRIKLSEELSNLSEEIRATQGDVVFICQDGKPVEVHSEILLMVSPMLRKILHGTLQTSFLVPKDFKIFISVEFNSKMLLTLLDMICHQKTKVIAKDQIEEFWSLVAALRISDTQFVQAEQTPDTEDDAIVDLIHDLMEEYNVHNETPDDLAEMMMTSIDESFNDTSLEFLLMEPFDSENQVKGDKAIVEEVIEKETPSFKIEEINDKNNNKKGSENKRKKPNRNETKSTITNCCVDIEILSNQILSYYYDILKRKKEQNLEEDKTKTNDGKKEKEVYASKETGPFKRKRKVKILPDFEYAPLKKASKRPSIFNNTSNDSGLNEKIMNQNKADQILGNKESEGKKTQITSLDNSESQESIAMFIMSSERVTTNEPGPPLLMSILKCKHCPESFTSAEERLSHIRAEHASLRKMFYNCRCCDAIFKDPKQFKLHLLSHKKELVQQ